MTNLETNLLEGLTCKAVRICSRAVPLFLTPFVEMGTILIRDFHNGFAKKALAGRTGHMIT